MRVADILHRFNGVKKQGAGFTAKCPAHNDKKPSLSISEGEGGKILLHCHAGCSVEDICRAIGLTPAALMGDDKQEDTVSKPRAVYYNYCDENGTLLFQKIRKMPKGFSQRQPDGEGGWVYNRNGVRLVPYRLPALLKAETVFLCEGEKDADTVAAMGLTATTSPDGAGKGKFKPDIVPYFKNKNVVILPDNDNVGKEFAIEEAEKIKAVAKSVKVLDLTKILPELVEHGDISDVVAIIGAEKAKVALLELAKATGEYNQATAGKKLIRCGSDIEIQEIDWLWNKVIAKGMLNSLQGVPSSGKTFITCAVCAAVTKGGQVQSVVGNGLFERVSAGRVLYLSGDDSVSKLLLPRLKKAGADPGNLFFPEKDLLPSIDSPEFELMVASVAPVLVVVDTLQHFLPTMTNVNDAVAVTHKLQPLKSIAEKYNVAVIVIQHISKVAASGNGGFSVNFGIGSSGINGLFRSVWTVGRIKDGDGKLTAKRALAPSKTNLVAGDLPSIVFELTERNGFQWAGIDHNVTAETLYSKPGGRPPIIEGVKSKITEYLQNAGKPVPSTILEKQVTKEMGCSVRTFKAACKEIGVAREKAEKIWFSRLPDDEEPHEPD